MIGWPASILVLIWTLSKLAGTKIPCVVENVDSSPRGRVLKH
jgi:hypothetical protein